MHITQRESAAHHKTTHVEKHLYILLDPPAAALYRSGAAGCGHGSGVGCRAATVCDVFAHAATGTLGPDSHGNVGCDGNDVRTVMRGCWRLFLGGCCDRVRCDRCGGCAGTWNGPGHGPGKVGSRPGPGARRVGLC
jgi:hypothetical protein